MDELEFALSTISGADFEDFAMAFLREEGYEVHESGGLGADGGWDAEIQLGDRIGIAHASTREDWRIKLRGDAVKVASLEDERSDDFDILAFVTNQEVTGKQELDIREEIREKYDWNLQLIHKKNILGELRQDKRSLAGDYLGLNLELDRNHIERIRELRAKRIEIIRDRAEYASDLPGGPALALHIIPNGIHSTETTVTSDAIPDPPVFFERHVYPETRGKYTIAFGQGGGLDHTPSYGVIRNDGLYESVSTSAFVDRYEGELWLRGTLEPSGIGLDPYVIWAVQDASECLDQMGLRGNAFVALSILDAGNLQLHAPDGHRRGLQYDPPSLGTDCYLSELYTFSIGDQEIIADVRPLLDEIWREFGHEGGTPSIENERWNQGTYTMNGEPWIQPGDW